MNLREWLDKNSALVVIGATLALVVALVSIVLSNRKGADESRYEGMWFIDLTTNQFFVGKPTDIPPIDAPSGQSLKNGQAAGVLAHVFGCGDSSVCQQDLTGRTPDELEDLGVFVGYLEKLTPESKADFEEMMEKFGSKSTMVSHMIGGRLLRLPDRNRWYGATTQFGREMQQDSSNRCTQPGDLRICRPGMRDDAVR